ncbi:MAG: DUF1559 domain-containing protein [Pirellulales bacterium]
MASWEHYLPLVLFVVGAIAIVPLIGGACLLLTSRLAKISTATFPKCYLAYLTAYLAATVVCLPITLMAVLKIQVPGYVLWPAFVLIAFGVHMVIIPKFLGLPFGKGLLVHGSAVFLVGLVLAAMLWFPVQLVRRQAQIAVVMGNLKQIGDAMHLHLERDQKFPPAASYAKNGRPLLSWRVHLLPFLEQQQLYEQFHLDEPWDSLHNKTLLAKMPAVYAPVNGSLEGSLTYFQVFVQKLDLSKQLDVQAMNPYGQFEAPFFVVEPGEDNPPPPEYMIQRAQQGFGFAQITDGLSRTFCVVEGGTAVPWTKPEDISYSPDRPIPALGGMFGDGFLAVLFDGSVRYVRKEESETVIRASITANGREDIDFSSY